MKIQSHANTFITMAILFTFMKHFFSWQIICQVHCTHAGNSLGIKQFYMWTRKCIYKASPLLPNLLHMCTRPATCISVTLFHPTYLGYLLVHVGTSRVFRISHILLLWTFFWLRHIWVTFYLMSNLAGSHLGSDLFSDASTLTNRPQICRFKSKIYHQCFNFD